MQSVSCDGRVRKVQHRLGKRKLQHDLTFAVGHFENGIQEAGLCAFGFQQLPDHRRRNFPCTIGIAQLFAFGIGNQLVADAGVEEIFRHCSDPPLGRLKVRNRRQLTSPFAVQHKANGIKTGLKKISLANFWFRITLSAWAESVRLKKLKKERAKMAWKTPKIVEVPVGMEINMYACAARK